MIKLEYSLNGNTLEITQFSVPNNLVGLDSFILEELILSFMDKADVIQVTANNHSQNSEYWSNFGFNFLFDVDDEYLHLLSPTETNLMYKVINGVDKYRVCYGKV